MNLRKIYSSGLNRWTFRRNYSQNYDQTYFKISEKLHWVINNVITVLCKPVVISFYCLPLIGRQIAVQYQQSQRIVLSPLVLVVNTLVAEFLYAQNCHFTLSVFNSEVPYKNTLPDFEKSYKFRFDSVELNEIMKVTTVVYVSAKF